MDRVMGYNNALFHIKDICLKANVDQRDDNGGNTESS